MRQRTGGRQAISAARRGQIVQRVLVDGWTAARVAAQFKVPQRFVEIWVADYRRRGMASLHRAPRQSVAAETAMLWLVRPADALFGRIWHGWRRLAAVRRMPPATIPGAAPVATDDRRGGAPGPRLS